MTYLATPYSHPDAGVREARFDQACRIAGGLMAAGEVIFAPICHTHPIAIRCDLPKDWEFWEKYDREMLAMASRLLVVKMDGWQTSRGIAAEIAIAQLWGIPVEYMAVPEAQDQAKEMALEGGE